MKLSLSPLLSGDLDQALCYTHPLLRLARMSDDHTWKINDRNAEYIKISLLKAMEVIEAKKLKHGDLKGD